MLDANRIENLVAEVMAESRTSGVSLSIFNNESVLYSKGFGTLSIESDKRVTTETPFQIASLTKPLTATLIMILVEKGFLNLDTPIVEYVPDIRFSVPEMEKTITLRKLLNHTTGLNNGGEFEGPISADALGNYVNKTIPQVRFEIKPDVMSYYSNHNFNIAGYVAEKAFGTPFPELMKKYVFDPVGMKDSFFGIDKDKKEIMANHHSVEENSKLSVDPVFVYNSEMAPSVMVNSTIENYTRFLMMLLNGGGIEKRDVIAPKQIEEMFKISAKDLCTKKEGTGLPFGIVQFENFKRVTHNGGVKSSETWFEIYPEKSVGIVLFSNFPMDRERLLSEIRSELEVSASSDKPRTIEPDSSLFPMFKGTYLGDFVGIIEIKVVEERLTAVKNGVACPLHCFEKNIFFATDEKGDELFSVGFVRNNSEKSEYLITGYNPCKRTKRDDVVYGKEIDDLNEFAGKYSYGSMKGAVDLLDGGLKYTSPEGDKIDLIPISENLFTSDIGLMSFKKENGKTIFSIQNTWDCVRDDETYV